MRRFHIFGLIALAGLIIGLAWAEEITLSTYYPAPYGVYNEMRARRIGIGENYYDSVANPIVGNTDLIVEGDVGIGTVSPIANLHIVGTGAVSLKVAGANNVAPWIHLERTEGGSTNDLWSLVVDAQEKFLIRRSMSTQFTIDNNGRVGIGTESPASPLHVIGKAIITGGVDPPYISFSNESHESIRQYAKEVEPHEKAMQFWNGEAHRLEVYVIDEERFYTITGELIED